MKQFFQRALLPFVVFVTGACVLIVEVVATRILSPYFGNTIFTVSSVISVILAALSIGYAIGGKIADARPTYPWFFGFIACSGLLVLGSHATSLYLLPTISRESSLIIGPLISSLAFFFLPSVILGMLSPYAVVIERRLNTDQGIGSVAGRMFFWSTLGSIIGSLSAGFILIPHLGVNTIMIANGIVLFVLGIVPLCILRVKRTALVKFFCAFLILAGLAVWTTGGACADGVVYQRDGVYERLTIYDRMIAGRPARVLSQDHTTSGGMFLDATSSLDLVYPYAEYAAMYQAAGTDVRRALVIGGGAYTVPRMYQALLPNATIDISEIEPFLPELAKTYFRFQESPNTHFIAEDGRRALQQSKDPYDVIFSDVYFSYFSIPSHFTTKEFFTLAKNKLSPNGVFIANVLGDLSRQQPSLFFSEIKTFKSVFPNMAIFAVADARTGPQNFIFVGYHSETPVDMQSIASRPNATPFMKQLPAHLLDLSRFEFSPYPILTDDYAPTDYFTAFTIKRMERFSKGIDGNEIRALLDQQLRYGPERSQEKREFVRAELLAQTPVVTETAANYSPGLTASFFPEREKRMRLETSLRLSPSGTAVLLYVADILSRLKDAPDVGVDLVFVDGETVADSVYPPTYRSVHPACGDRCSAKELENNAREILQSIQTGQFIAK